MDREFTFHITFKRNNKVNHYPLLKQQNMQNQAKWETTTIVHHVVNQAFHLTSTNRVHSQ